VLCISVGYDRVVDMNTVSQMATVALAVLAIIWNQQRTTDKLRGRMDARLDASDREHRAVDSELREVLGEVKERLARIEGFLGIGTPTPPRPDSAPE
jgi:hypothetical protein